MLRGFWVIAWCFTPGIGVPVVCYYCPFFNATTYRSSSSHFSDRRFPHNPLPIYPANDCYAIGPWDCQVGSPLTVEQCCNIIKSDVTDPDVNGNEINCVADPPMGSDTKPIDHGRVIIHIDANNMVQHPPRNE